MMCRSTSDLSLLVSMQFFTNYRITLTTHIDVYTKTKQTPISYQQDRVITVCRDELVPLLDKIVDKDGKIPPGKQVSDIQEELRETYFNFLTSDNPPEPGSSEDEDTKEGSLELLYFPPPCCPRNTTPDATGNYCVPCADTQRNHGLSQTLFIASGSAKPAKLESGNWFVCDLQICCHFTTQNRQTNLKTNGENRLLHCQNATCVCV
jgi:hypothetical protein